MDMFTRVIVRLTARRWNKIIASTLLQHHEIGAINSHQLHALAHEFDPTQSTGRVARIIAGGPNDRFSDALLRYRGAPS